jgi:hypothetical protein
MNTFARVKPYELRWLSTFGRGLSSAEWGRIRGARRPNKRRLKRADAVPVLDCQSCGALAPGEQFRYYGD